MRSTVPAAWAALHKATTAAAASAPRDKKSSHAFIRVSSRDGAASGAHPAVPAVARRRTFLEIRHLDLAQPVGGNLIALGSHVHAEDLRRVQPEDLLLHRRRKRRVAMLLDQRL